MRCHLPAALLFTSIGAAAATGQVTERCTLNSSAGQSNDRSVGRATSANGRYVVFDSEASNLVSGDTNGLEDVFVHDRLLQTTRRVSVSSSGVQGDSVSRTGAISPDGRLVAFHSLARNLVPGDTNGQGDVFVHDLEDATTVRVSVSSSGQEGNDKSFWPVFSGDGRFVAFGSDASNLVLGDTNTERDVFVHDRSTGAIERVSVDSSGAEGNDLSWGPVLSHDGRLVAFTSEADNLVPGDTNGDGDVFVHDRQTGITERISVSTAGAQADGPSSGPGISRDGRIVSFTSHGTNLVNRDRNDARDAFVRNRATGRTTRVSVSSSGDEGDSFVNTCRLSASGRWVAFGSYSSNLVPGDTNGFEDVFVHDRVTDETRRVSLSTAGDQANSNVAVCDISRDGRFVAMQSNATNLVPGDSNGVYDVFVHGPELILEASRDIALPSDTLEVAAFSGNVGDAVALVIDERGGLDVFVLVELSTFEASARPDGRGTWSRSGTVPSGLAGLDVSLRVYGISWLTAKYVRSNPARIRFQ